MHRMNCGTLSVVLILVIYISESLGSPNPVSLADETRYKGRNVRKTCDPSVTTVNGKQVCQKELIFEDNFDSLDDTKWRKDLMIANGPDYEFVLYENSERNTFIQDGVLHLKPTIPTNVERIALNGHIDLRKRGCTGASQEECQQDASAYNILPPVVSARIKTSQAFSFKYGVVEVRAKLPDGDWLYPELWLEPLDKFYGLGYSSGRVVLATARGNAQLLTSDGEDIGAKRLAGGLIMAADEPDRSVFLRKKLRNPELDEAWNEAFHTFKFTWSPDGAVMSVDGEDYGAVNSIPIGGFGSVFETTKWDEGSPMAPFDREFYVTLGVGAGGIREFPDNTTIGGHVKPWRNKSAKAKLDFLKDWKNWKYSWAWEEAALQVDYIKVWAL